MDKPDKMEWCSKRATEANIADYNEAKKIDYMLSLHTFEEDVAIPYWDPEDFFDEYDELYGDGK